MAEMAFPTAGFRGAPARLEAPGGRGARGRWSDRALSSHGAGI